MTGERLEEFKVLWRGHNIPDDLHSIAFDFDARGNIVDIDAQNEGGGYIDTTHFDGFALSALAYEALALPEEA